MNKNDIISLLYQTAKEEGYSWINSKDAFLFLEKVNPEITLSEAINLTFEARRKFIEWLTYGEEV